VQILQKLIKSLPLRWHGHVERMDAIKIGKLTTEGTRKKRKTM
jgi:hypothetical protein